jgi:hypothetical protein
MPKLLISPEEFDAELKRHGLSVVPVQSANLAVWRNRQATVFLTLARMRGFVPVQILVDALRDAGIEYNPDGAP